MWIRSELKEQAKARLKINYWKMVLVGFILSIILGGGLFGGYSSNFTYNLDKHSFENIFSKETDSPSTDLEYNLNEIKDGNTVAILAIIMIIVVCVLAVLLICMIIAFAIYAILLNPLLVGCRRFFIKNLHEEAKVKEVCFNYDHNYKNCVKTMFFRDLYTFLWSLLFIIPGFIKSYEYLMIPNILANNPEISKEEAFAMSKQMMMGNKWKAFVLDLSFIGWNLLSIPTFGLLGIFYVAPYKYQTHAALYERLLEEKGYIKEQQ